jgi:hypothetical protein
MGTRMLPTTRHPTLGAAPAAGGWHELADALPIVVLYRALREEFRRRAHRRAVLAAFRR